MNTQTLEHFLPISVIVPHLSSRDEFFYDHCLPSINKNNPGQVIIIADRGNAAQQRNIGFKQVNQPYVFFCDDDIVLQRDCLKILYDALWDNPDHAFAYCDYQGIVSNPAAHPNRTHFIHSAMPFDLGKLRQMNFISTMSLLHTRLFPGFDEILQRYYDWDLWLNLAYRGYTGYHVPRVLFTAHFMDNGISSQQESRQQSIAVVRHKWGRKST